jgi:hypothetical protein
MSTTPSNSRTVRASQARPVVSRRANPFTLATLVTLAGLAGLSLGEAAMAQNVLERDLRVNSRFQQAPPSARGNLADSLRMRNALVTGNVGGGRSLQISRPYLDAGDLKTQLGTDDLFSFRRDSFSAGSIGIRGTDSLQYQNAFSTGGMGLVPRSGFSSSARVGAATMAPTRFGDPIRGSVGGRSEDDNSTTFGTLRSTSSFTATQSLSPSSIGYRRTPDGLDRVTASSLMGVRMQATELGGPRSRFAEDRSGNLIAANESNAVATNRTPTAYDSLLTRLDNSFASQRLNTRVNNAVDRTPATPAPTGTDLLRPAGTSPTSPPPPPPTGTTPAAANDAARQPSAPAWEAPVSRIAEHLSMLTATGSARGATARAVNEASNPVIFEADTIRALREAGGTADTLLVGTVAAGDFFGEYLQAGQEAMAIGRFFDAEERFVRALGIRPDDVTAQVGRAHAQLGAGLFVSAAMNIRQLYEKHPELLGVRFTGAAVPPGPRLNSLVTDLRASISRQAELNLNPPEDSSLLLTYVGRLLGDEAIIREGIAVLRKANTGATKDAIPDLLESMWLGKDPQPSPTPPPAEAPKPAEEPTK